MAPSCYAIPRGQVESEEKQYLERCASRVGTDLNDLLKISSAERQAKLRPFLTAPGWLWMLKETVDDGHLCGAGFLYSGDHLACARPLVQDC